MKQYHHNKINMIKKLIVVYNKYLKTYKILNNY